VPSHRRKLENDVPAREGVLVLTEGFRRGVNRGIAGEKVFFEVVKGFEKGSRERRLFLGVPSTPRSPCAGGEEYSLT
jgi:hypothetical protein